MTAITLETTDQKYLISIDRLRTEALADQMNTDEADLMALSEEIKANWWAANQAKILNRVAAYTPPNQ